LARLCRRFGETAGGGGSFVLPLRRPGASAASWGGLCASSARGVRGGLWFAPHGRRFFFGGAVAGLARPCLAEARRGRGWVESGKGV
jgi:hypothetical protein